MDLKKNLQQKFIFHLPNHQEMKKKDGEKLGA
jgi:hypothetical protein